MVYIIALIGFFFGLFQFGDVYIGTSFCLFAILVFRIVQNSSTSFVFREWALLLYVLNYLISPAVTYSLSNEVVLYGMKIQQDRYFELALPGILLYSFLAYLTRKRFTLDSQENKRKLLHLNLAGQKR